MKNVALYNLWTMQQANVFIPGFLEEHNKRFGKEPVDPKDAHRPLRRQDDLKRIFARKEKWRLSKDLAFQYQGVLYMIETNNPNRLKHATIEVLSRKNEELEVEYNGLKVNYKKWSETVYERPEVVDAKEIERWISKKAPKISRRHPWR